MSSCQVIKGVPVNRMVDPKLYILKLVYNSRLRIGFMVDSSITEMAFLGDSEPYH